MKTVATDTDAILSQLNQEQRTAVTAPHSPVLVLAGAGSGKTRVLVHRIAWLCHMENISPYAIVAVTFTNKAAREMRARAEDLLGFPLSGTWLGTFHGLCHRFLRMHYQEAKLPQTFQVLDASDQRRVVRRATQNLGLDEAHWPSKKSQWFINARKEAGLRPDSIQHTDDREHDQMLRIYTAYEKTCRQAGLVDFAELLLGALEVLRDNDGLLQHYRERFRHILVDEFQDTNSLQYAWIRVLAGEETPVFAVGDDDQSIYGWRGARVENIQDFTRDFKHTQVYRLERNYRSTSTILDAANALIEHNQGRMGKALWTKSGRGSPITVFAAFSETEEAAFIADRITNWNRGGRARSEAAVLYRSNAQSRIIEQTLIKEGLPYRIYGGYRFFERAVIKNALAYLRLLAHRDDDPSFERIVNFPPRGIGGKTVNEIRLRAGRDGCSLWAAGLSLLKENEQDDGRVLSTRAANALRSFYQLIADFSRDFADRPLSEQARFATQFLIDYHREKGSGETALSDIENLEEFIVAARDFEKSWSPANSSELSMLDEFLAHAALEAGESQGPADKDSVQMMTLHSAKGLEFPLVIMAGLEEGLFPHERSLYEQGSLEEERRLCYVGITRAREELIICHAETRNRGYGKTACNPVSRFIGELPAKLLQEIRPRLHVQRMPRRRRGENSGADAGGIETGQLVRHATFGEGVVIHCEGDGEHARAQVRFKHAGTKWLVLAFAKLEPIPDAG